MAICFCCGECDNQTFEEISDQYFCGCNYHIGLAKSNSIKLQKIEKESKNKQVVSEKIFSDIADLNLDINESDMSKLRNVLKEHLNIQISKTISI